MDAFVLLGVKEAVPSELRVKFFSEETERKNATSHSEKFGNFKAGRNQAKVLSSVVQAEKLEALEQSEGNSNWLRG